jgi:hypothetical protein
MYKTQVSSYDIVNFLNELLKLDNDMINCLCFQRIPCNQLIVNHPSVQVSQINNNFCVGLLGILNGLIGVDKEHYGCIQTETEQCSFYPTGYKITSFIIDEDRIKKEKNNA